MSSSKRTGTFLTSSTLTWSAATPASAISPSSTYSWIVAEEVPTGTSASAVSVGDRRLRRHDDAEAALALVGAEHDRRDRDRLAARLRGSRRR